MKILTKEVKMGIKLLAMMLLFFGIINCEEATPTAPTETESETLIGKWKCEESYSSTDGINYVPSNDTGSYYVFKTGDSLAVYTKGTSTTECTKSSFNKVGEDSLNLRFDISNDTFTAYYKIKGDSLTYNVDYGDNDYRKLSLINYSGTVPPSDWLDNLIPNGGQQ